MKPSSALPVNRGAIRLVSLAALALLCGCEAAERVAASAIASAPEPVLVLRPGVKVLMDGEPVAVVGADRCPEQDGMMRALFGAEPLAGEPGCMVLSDDRKHVEARFRGNDGRMVVEQWAILRTQGPTGLPRTSLQRPNGSPVISAGARKVDVQDVTLLSDGRVSVDARLTRETGAKVTCSYIMQTTSDYVGGTTAPQFTQVSEACDAGSDHGDLR